MFARGQDHLDPRIFNGAEEMHPELRKALLGTLAAFWDPIYPGWAVWAKVYLAGSAASYWWDSDTDLDVLVGIDMAGLRAARPQNIGVSEADVCAHLDRGLKDILDLTTTDYLGLGLAATFFVNPNSYDIRTIRPYAAYSISGDEWVVHPPKLPADWGPRYFPEEWWREVLTLGQRVDDIMAMVEPERTEVGVALFDTLHADRQKAYSALGEGWLDKGNFVWQALSQIHKLQPLYRLKHPELATTAAGPVYRTLCATCAEKLGLTRGDEKVFEDVCSECDKIKMCRRWHTGEFGRA